MKKFIIAYIGGFIAFSLYLMVGGFSLYATIHYGNANLWPETIVSTSIFVPWLFSTGIVVGSFLV